MAQYYAACGVYVAPRGKGAFFVDAVLVLANLRARLLTVHNEADGSRYGVTYALKHQVHLRLPLTALVEIRKVLIKMQKWLPHRKARRLTVAGRQGGVSEWSPSDWGDLQIAPGRLP